MSTEEKPVSAETLGGTDNSEPTEEQKIKKQLRRAERGVKDYQRLLLRLAALLLVIWLLFFQIVGLTHMPNDDMSPRLDAGDLVLFYRLDKDVQAQDVVVIEKATPDNPKKQLFICRVVAVEGDVVEITDEQHLKINGNSVIEPKIYSLTPRYEGFTRYPLKLGEKECFVLADKRGGGTDSRYFGGVEKDEILGTVITILRRNEL